MPLLDLPLSFVPNEESLSNPSSSNKEQIRYSTISSGGSKGGQGMHAPRGSKLCNFGKFWQNRMLAPPPRGNPGSAADF